MKTTNELINLKNNKNDKFTQGLVKTAEGYTLDYLADIRVIGTHNGCFHADEVLCCAMLCIINGIDPVDLTFIRSRDEDSLAKADIVFDVGEGCLDHHGKMAEEGVAACSRFFAAVKPILSPYMANKLAEVVNQVASFDCGETGVPQRFPFVHTFNRMAIVDGRVEENFRTAVQMLVYELTALWEIWYAEEAAEASVLNTLVEQSVKAVISFEAAARLADVKSILWAQDQGRNCVYYISPETPSDWRVLCAATPGEAYSPFNSRKLIPEKYRGLRGEELSKVSGIPGGIFCHAAGFIAGFNTKEAAVAFAEKCLCE